jgi:aspartyl/glutamyl-tRNA(Asn/Gln) amidotransferase C subunit
MAKLQQQDVQKAANLIKIHLSQSEVESYQSQLNTVIPSVDVLKELDTSTVAETSQTHGLKNVTSDDVPQEGLDISKYPNRKNLKNNYFVVNRVIN